MISGQNTQLVEMGEAIRLEDSAKLLGLSRWYLARKNSRSRLGLKEVRVRTSLDARVVWLSKSSVAAAIAARAR